MNGFLFSAFRPEDDGKTAFERLLDLWMQLFHFTAGDAAEALRWLSALDREHGLTDEEYGIGDFIEDLKSNGYLNEEEQGFRISAKAEQSIRKRALEEIFGKMKKSRNGLHRSTHTGQGDEINPELRPYEFGDPLESIDFPDSIRNAYVNHGFDTFSIREQDLSIHETDFKAQSATVMMIDISHSMILYGEDRITPARKVALALAELITTRYPKDTLDIVVFGNDAWQVELKELPYLQVGPYHTNTVAGLELAMDILRRRKNPNKQIFMITDGKPTCLKLGKRYYKNAFGIDAKILNRTLNLAGQLRRLKTPVVTFMIARDPYLQAFVREFTEVNGGKVFYASLDNLGTFVFEDYERNKRKSLR
ncbi:MAG: VWA domain-containing protein [Bacteroidetes bacterium]|nr:VWA domain-containing protein [Bacteroidota bacterium]